MSLAPLILLYNSTGSKTAVDIFSHTLPSGGYTFLQNWLLTLKPNPCVPMNEISDLVYAFDNNQRLQKVWLSRNANKQTLEVMTNIIKLELNGFNCQKNEVLDPRHWRKFENLGPFEEVQPTEQDSLNVLQTTLETVLQQYNVDTETDTIQSKITDDNFKSKFIQCHQCNKTFGKNKIKCDVCKINLRNGTLPQEAISTKIVREKNKKRLSLLTTQKTSRMMGV
ncbi:unnamed protein product [Mytilus edulis]|nr:unnamed protein product [Mytilus edulis]